MVSMAYLLYYLTHIDSLIVYVLRCWPSWSNYWMVISWVYVYMFIVQEALHAIGVLRGGGKGALPPAPKIG